MHVSGSRKGISGGRGGAYFIVYLITESVSEIY